VSKTGHSQVPHRSGLIYCHTLTSLFLSFSFHFPLTLLTHLIFFAYSASNRWSPEESIKSRQDLCKTVQVIPFPVVFDGQNTYYGTRLATVLLIRRDGQVLFIERDMWELGPDGLPTKADPPKERTFRFKINLDNQSPGIV
jgi:hypothetical protein